MTDGYGMKTPPAPRSAGSDGSDVFDIAIVGGGPAGLSAAVAAGRMNRRAICFETGTPRTAHAPRYFNYLGFPEGVSGREMLRLGREQARRWGAVLRDSEVIAVEPLPADGAAPPAGGGRFRVRTRDGDVVARGVVFATGIADRQPRCGSLYGEPGIHYCAVCDGYETRGSRVAVVGHDRRAFSMLRALRDFTDDVHLLTDGCPLALDEAQRRLLEEWRVPIHPHALERHSYASDGVHFHMESGGELVFPHVFVALGASPSTRIAADLGCRLDAERFIVTDATQATSVAFVYAAGDCDGGHKQVTQAMAEGEMAALELARSLRRAGDRPLGAQ
jgi:thioredoxin reductase (NADPH)